MTTIKELDLMKRKVHKEKYEAMYPDGVFALHVVGIAEPRYIIAWTKKSDDVTKFSTHYNEIGFQIDNRMVFSRTTYQSWQSKTNRYNSLEKVLKRALKLKISYEQRATFVELYLKYSGKNDSDRTAVYKIVRSIK